MNIEFIGVPGSGKSFLRKALLFSLHKEQHRVSLSFEQAFYAVAKKEIDIAYRVFLKALPKNIGMKLSQKIINRSLMQFQAQGRFLAKSGGALEAFLASPQYVSMSIEDRETVISTFLQVGSMHECIAGRFTEQTRIVVDEGFVQKSFMFVSPNSDFESGRPFVYSYLKHIPLPDIIFRVKTDNNICYKRLMSRTQGLTERLIRLKTPERIHDFLQTSEMHLEDITAWLKKGTSINIIEIENNIFERSQTNFDRHLVAIDR